MNLRHTNVLIVNDVQDTQIPTGYIGGYQPLIRIEEQIVEAIAKGETILLVKINDPRCGPIHPRVMKLVKGYKQCFTVDKEPEFNGAKWIVAKCRELGISVRRARIVGFQTHKCVQGTVRGLTVLGWRCIQVIKDACDNQNGNRWSTFPQLPGVVLLNSDEARLRQ